MVNGIEMEVFECEEEEFIEEGQAVDKELRMLGNGVMIKANGLCEVVMFQLNATTFIS